MANGEQARTYSIEELVEVGWRGVLDTKGLGHIAIPHEVIQKGAIEVRQQLMTPVQGELFDDSIYGC